MAPFWLCSSKNGQSGFGPKMDIDCLSAGGSTNLAKTLMSAGEKLTDQSVRQD